MVAATAARPAGAWQIPPVSLTVTVPLLLYAVLAAIPQLNVLLVVPTEHFFIVTIVSLLAVGVAILLARSAVQM